MASPRPWYKGLIVVNPQGSIMDTAADEAELATKEPNGVFYVFKFVRQTVEKNDFNK
jgi:hypothetical protein